MTLTWDMAFHQLWTHAAKHRGVQGSDDGTHPWPRTCGSDVLAIASVVDPAVRALPAEAGSLGVQRGWRYCASDLADFAVARPNHEYVQNRAFWASLAATLAYLASIDAPVPHELWPALLDEIERSHEELEASGDRHIHFTADSYDELWRLQKARLVELRGEDARRPSYDSGLWPTVPRTTNRDILQLATLWSFALIKAEPKAAALGLERRAMTGLDGVRRRWRAVMADIDALARNGDPHAVYPKNHEFWSTTAAMSVTLSVIDDLPLSLDFAVSEGPARHRNGRTYNIKERTFDQVWSTLSDQLAKARGSDERTPPEGASGNSIQVPRTTKGDIVQLAAYWNDAWTQFEDAWRRGNVLGRIADPLGLIAERARWQAATTEVENTAKAGKASDVFPQNDGFWRASRSLAAALDRYGQRPTRSQITLDVPDVPEESLPERVVDFLTDLGGRMADAAGTVAHAVKDLGREAGKGFFDGLGGPLVLSAGGILALWLLLRHRDHRDAVEGA
jgi:hypothetical protein